MKLIECVPNFSEGRRPEVVDAIRDRIAAVKGVSVLDVTSDASHNRSVITFVVPAERAVDAALAGIRAARDRIDLTQHSGEHPRIGAADVVPFIPLDGATMDDCVALARALGERVGRELEIPVYLYERAASSPARVNLADVRRGEFEGLRDIIATDAARAPDYGPARVHPTAGAVAIGARPFLVAYNVYLGDAANLAVAKQVARAVRTSSGGLPALKALGLEVDGQAQVSMNLVDTEQTPLADALAAVRAEASARAVEVTWSEIIGLVPERVVFHTAARHLMLREPLAEHVLERKVLALHANEQTVAGLLDAVASADPFPGGGTVAGYVGALSAALAAMVARLTLGRARYADAAAEMQAIVEQADGLAGTLSALALSDAEAYSAVTDAYRLPRRDETETAARHEAIHAATLGATRVPLETARACARCAALAAAAAERGNRNAASDAGVAALLAESGCRAADYNVRVNVKALPGSAEALAMAHESAQLVRHAARDAALAREAVERALLA